MNYLEELKSNITYLQSGIEDLVDMAVMDNEKQIRDWIINRWETGKTPTGDLIGLYRSEDYASLKNAMNSYAGFGNVDLTLTGALGRGIKINPLGDESYEVFSTDWKYEKIVEKYGEINFNISEAERKILFEKITLIVLLNLNEAYE